MRLFYFVGGPTAGSEEAFGRRLAELGGPPPGWQVYPFADGGGQALHLVTADAESAIDAHLANFAPHYECGPVIELVTGQRSVAGEGDRP
jgi:hypothetical protein